MSADFYKFGNLVRAKFADMSKGELYTVETNNLWDYYLTTFPEGSNELFGTRTEHDCQCCRQFLRNVGDVVSINVDGTLETIWDVVGAEYPYDVVAEKMKVFVKSAKINGLFRTTEKSFGANTTSSHVDGKLLNWNHFSCLIDKKYQSDAVGTVKSEFSSKAAVFSRGLSEISIVALETIEDIVETNSLYRGAEFLAPVTAFKNLLKEYNSSRNKDAFIWKNCNHFAAIIRNTAIGSLALDLSEGKDLESSVKSFESKVGAINYKRPTALITQGMIDLAMKTIDDLGLESALHRRFANISDVHINDVLFVDNSVKSLLKGGIAGLLEEEVAQKSVDMSNTQDIDIDSFMRNIVPRSKSVKLFVENEHTGNFASITAPIDADAKKIFKWNNGFAWSYDGNIADSIKEKVKRAGGNVDAKLRVSLSWFNTDDLDIHVIEPNGNRIYFGNKSNKLDVDMNVGGESREPVENVSWNTIVDGKYKIIVNNFRLRETSNFGFVIEIANENNVNHISHNKIVRGEVEVADMIVKNGTIQSITCKDGMENKSISQHKWGVDTQTLVTVKTIMKSPNHWGDNSVGNLHWFFILENCINNAPTRGIYNEFLIQELDKHRKVFEVLGNKTMCQPVSNQLSGLGFSSTKKDSVKVFAKGENIHGNYKIKF